jgi:formate dehydrogenase major subunit
MAKVNITINGQQITAEAGLTILQAARTANIDIPVLCEHPSLTAWGACRVCLVEIANQRALQPACTFPISEGLEIWTESEKVVNSRKFVLELLFSERNHFCMYCQMSGDCELQDLAYRYGLDHWTYNRSYEPRQLDATRKYFVMEPNRCVLCRRCLRACADIAASHTLGLKERGANSVIIADHDVPFGESTCVECGTCLQVCPTGALMDRRAAYGYRDKDDVVSTRSVCTQCSVGCAIDVITKDNRVLRVDGAWDAGPSKGLLCVDGRFKPLYETRERVTTPMIRRNGALQAADWDEALALIAGKMQGAPAMGVAASATTNEALQAFADLFQKANGAAGRVEGGLPDLGYRKHATLQDVEAADFIIVAGVDPLSQNRVVGYLAKRAIDRGARLAIIGDAQNGMSSYATLVASDTEANEVIELAQKAEHAVVLYGPALTPEAMESLKPLAYTALFLGLDGTRNGSGALAAGLDPIDPQKAGVLFLLAGDTNRSEAFDAYLNGAFTVVQTSSQSALLEKADVVLPAPVWSEQAGHMTNLEGKQFTLHAAAPMPAGVRSEAEVLKALADML